MRHTETGGTALVTLRAFENVHQPKGVWELVDDGDSPEAPADTGDDETADDGGEQE